MADWLRFSWIGICFLLSFGGGVPLAAGLTLCADFFLIFTPHYGIGVAFFIFVQFAYIQNLRGAPFHLLPLLLIPLLCLLPLPVLGSGYALLALCHFSLAIKKAKAIRRVSAMLYAFALCLFAACDITVAWGYFSRPMPGLVWLFYAPSQLLLALTARSWQPPRRPFHLRKGTKALPSRPADPWRMS